MTIRQNMKRYVSIVRAFLNAQKIENNYITEEQYNEAKKQIIALSLFLY